MRDKIWLFNIALILSGGEGIFIGYPGRQSSGNMYVENAQPGDSGIDQYDTSNRTVFVPLQVCLILTSTI